MVSPIWGLLSSKLEVHHDDQQRTLMVVALRPELEFQQILRSGELQSTTHIDNQSDSFTAPHPSIVDGEYSAGLRRLLMMIALSPRAIGWITAHNWRYVWDKCEELGTSCRKAGRSPRGAG